MTSSCPTCQAPMHSFAREALDGLVWRCYKKICRKFTILRLGSFLVGNKTPLKKITLYLYFWCNELPPSQTIASDWEISERTILNVNVTSSRKFLANLHTPMDPIGRPNDIVEIEKEKIANLHTLHPRIC